MGLAVIVTIDYETTYSQEYSLRKLSEVGYILDARFQVIMCAIKKGNGPSRVFIGKDNIARELATIDWNTTALLAHNTRFDGAILGWHFGIYPKMYLDTMGMAKALVYPLTGSASLDNVSKYLSLPPKGHYVGNAIGKRLEDFSAGELADYAAYCLRDNDNCYDIFHLLLRRFPRSELGVIDLMLRMFIVPQARLDMFSLAEHLHAVRAEREALFNRVAHIDRSVFSSSAKFKVLLEDQGVEVPTKVSPTTGEIIPALAKGDREFKELCRDESLPPLVQALLAARIGAKSTIEETRSARMLDSAQRLWPDGTTGWLAVPLRYYGAHTGRASGDDGINLQNLRRASGIKQGIVAPPGYAIVHRDSSQIEARTNAWVSGCTSLLVAFAEGRDVYSEFASIVYRRRITKADKTERFVGKTCLAAGTRVLTNTGVVAIEDVTTDHLLWDGVEWVSHDGLAAYGPKETLMLSGVCLTPDHLVWCGSRWQEARSLARDAGGHSLKSALAAANLPSPDMWSASAGACRHSQSAATAGVRNTLLTGITLRRFAAHAATPARRWRRLTSDIGCMLPRWAMTAIAHAYSTGWLRRSRAAITLVAKYTSITESAAYTFASSGARTARPFFGMCSLSQDGTTRRGIWTGWTTIKGMSPAISGSLRAHRTLVTNATSAISNGASASLRPVFDLLNAGPRSRFTILTDAGPMIVSNSILGLGYGMGGPRFRHTLFIGNGGISVDVTETEARSLVWKYRETYPEIATGWIRAEAMLHQMLREQQPIAGGLFPVRHELAMGVLPAIAFTAEAIMLPNGMPMGYPDLQVDRSQGTNEVSYRGPHGERRRLFGGKIIENVCQALARIIITDAMRRVYAETDYWPLMFTHDSLDYLVPEGDAREFDAYLERQFAIRPTWAPDLPLASEGGWGRTLAAAEHAENL